MQKEFLKGTLKTIILKLLSEREQMYGYEITQHVKILTDSKIVLTEGALYPSLHKLEAEGLLKTKTINVGNRQRKYYSLTKKGGKVARQHVEDWIEFFNTVGYIINPSIG